MSRTLFIIDESPAIHRLFEEASQEEGFTLRTFTDALTALEEAQAHPPAMIIADYHLEGLTFTTFCEKLGEQDIIPKAYLVLLAGSTDQYDEASMLTRGVQGFLHKPIKQEDLSEMFVAFEIAEKNRKKKKSKKAKSWPPETTMTDLEDPLLLEEDENEEEPILIEIIQPELPPMAHAEEKPSERPPKKSKARNRVMSRTTAPDKPQSPVASPEDNPQDSAEIKPPSAPDKALSPTQSAETGESQPPSSAEKEHTDTETVPPDPPDPPTPTPNLRLGSAFPKLDGKQSAASSTAAAGALFHKKPKRLPTERSSMAQAQDPSQALPPQLETAMRGFLDQLTQTVGQSSSDQNHQFEDLVKQTVATQLPALVKQEVESSITSHLNEEYLKTLIQAAVQTQLPDLIAQQIQTNTDLLKESLRQHTQEQIESLAPQLVQDLTEPAIKKYLPNALKEQADNVDGLVKETAVELVMPHVSGSIDQVIREVAGGRIEELVQSVVPDLAEEQIKKEIARLTEPED